jgi:hypothetical protein
MYDVSVCAVCVVWAGAAGVQRCRAESCERRAKASNDHGLCAEHESQRWQMRKKRMTESDDTSSSAPVTLALTPAAQAAICAPKTTQQQRLTEGQRWAIIAYLADEKSFAWIAEKINCNVRTVARWAVRFLRTAELKDKQRSGRPPLLDETKNSSETK